MAVYLGRNTSIGFSEETTWGTPTSRTNWRPVASVSLSRKVTQVPRPDLKSDAGSAMRRGHFQSEEVCDGSASMAASYDSIGMLLKHGLGTLADAGSGPSSYTHTYTLAASPPTGLTVETVRGTSGQSEVFEGVKVNNLTLSVAAGEAMMLDLDFIAQTGTRGSAGSPTYGSNENLILHSQAGQFAFNGSNYDLKSLTLKVENSLDRRQLLGSVLTSEPVRSDFMSVTLDVELEAVDALSAALVAGTQSDATITFTSGTRSFAITCQNAYLSTATDDIGDAGIVSMSCSFVCESDGTDEGLSILVTNSDASGTQN